MVVFDDVTVPWERVFVLGHPELCNGFYSQTAAVVHMTHQVMTRTNTKTESILGLVSLLTQAIGIEQFPHIQADLAEVIMTLETCVRYCAPPRLTQRPTIRRPHAGLGAAQRGPQPVPEALPAVAGDRPQARRVRPDGHPHRGRRHRPRGGRHRDLPAVRPLGGAERVRLFRLAWDASISAFSGRQALYEYYFFGDPVRMAGA